MTKEKDMRLRLILIFIVVSLTLIVFMLPIDTATGAFIFSLESGQIKEGAKDFFTRYYTLYTFILIIIASLAIGGNYYINWQQSQARQTLTALPLKKRVELKNFVKSALGKGYTEGEIKAMLDGYGWDEKYSNAILKIF